MSGIFDLLSAEDLCAKLEHDFKRVRESPSDVYAAFDFVITAWHLLEWRYPGDEAQQKEVRQQYPIVELCEHLAVRSKHYQPTQKRHRTARASRRDSVWKRGVWAPGAWAPGFWKDELMIELAGAAQVEFGDEMPFSRFAKLVMDFWRTVGGCSGKSVPGTAP